MGDLLGGGCKEGEGEDWILRAEANCAEVGPSGPVKPRGDRDAAAAAATAPRGCELDIGGRALDDRGASERAALLRLGVTLHRAAVSLLRHQVNAWYLLQLDFKGGERGGGDTNLSDLIEL